MTVAPNIQATAALMGRVFPGTLPADPAYLRWLYCDSPFGTVLEANLDADYGRAGHYAVVPVDLVAAGIPLRGALSLNTAVDERARGGGVFVTLAEQAYATATGSGVDVVVGVANANSTPGFVRRLAFDLVAPLPAQVILPLPWAGRRGRSAAGVDGLALVAEGRDLLDPLPHGLQRRWDPAALSWRLAAPGGKYVVHDTNGALAVSTLQRRAGIRIAMLLAVFAPRPLSPSAASDVVARVCRSHRAAVALHVGFNEHFRVRGLPLPGRLRPSPLNFIFRDLRGGAAAPDVSRWELLDFDAY